MKSNILDKVFLIGLLASIIFPIFLHYHLNNPNSKYLSPDKINDIQYSIDQCTYKDSVFITSGWAFLPKGSQEKLTRIFIDADEHLYPIYKKTLKSDDIKNLFGGNKKHGMAAFYGARKIRSLPENLSVIISIEDMDGNIHETKHNCQ